jgi:Na+-translocating ferredoxin:NAD+ oxidoreductase subunit C
MGWFHWQCDESPWPAEPPAFAALPIDAAPAAEEIKIDRRGCPNLSAQLEEAKRKPIDTIICSALDGDPTLRLNAAVAHRQAAQVAAAVRKLAEDNDARRAWIVVEIDAPDSWVHPLLAEARRHNLEIVEVPNEYPQADPTLLIYTLLRRRLKPGHSPTECGVLILDAPAAATMGGANSTVPLGFRAERDCRSNYYEVPAGVQWKDVLSAARIYTDVAAIRTGDLPRDLRLNPLSIVGSGELTLHISPPPVPVNPESCIRCGWCVQVCPTGAHPAMLLEAAQTGNAHRARRGRLSACIECGVCDQVCPSNLPLLAAIRRIK